MVNSIAKEYVSEYFGKHPIHESVVPNMSWDWLSFPGAYIEEGLIRTFPIEDVVNAMCEHYGFTEYTGLQRVDCYRKAVAELGDRAGFVSIIDSENSTIELMVCTSGSEYNLSALNQLLNKYGYFIGTSKPLGVDDFTLIRYEKRFDTDATVASRLTGELYHVCRKDVLNKVLKSGLSPRESQGTTFCHGYSVYLFTHVPSSTEVLSIAFNKRLAQYSLLSVDVSQLPEWFKFYVDQRMSNAVYTLNTITPNALSVYKDKIF